MGKGTVDFEGYHLERASKFLKIRVFASKRTSRPHQHSQNVKNNSAVDHDGKQIQRPRVSTSDSTPNVRLIKKEINILQQTTKEEQ